MHTISSYREQHPASWHRVRTPVSTGVTQCWWFPDFLPVKSLDGTICYHRTWITISKRTWKKNKKKSDTSRTDYCSSSCCIAFSKGKRYATFVRLLIYLFLFKISPKVLDRYRTNFQTWSFLANLKTIRFRAPPPHGVDKIIDPLCTACSMLGLSIHKGVPHFGYHDTYKSILRPGLWCTLKFLLTYGHRANFGRCISIHTT